MLVGASGVTGLNLYSLAVAVVGAIVVLVLFHAIRRVSRGPLLIARRETKDVSLRITLAAVEAQ
jgi:hypothetical protein